MYTYIPSFLSLHSTPRGHHRVLSWAPYAISKFPLATDFTHSSVYVSMLDSPYFFISLLSPGTQPSSQINIRQT